ncbi:uncharacterized protein TNCV_1410621 [Trichonephila clavipes]|nr:uncharacterized protein TNCV_1410621 [Trichonephila clavipes]
MVYVPRAQVTSRNEIKNALEDLIEDNTQTPDTRVTPEAFHKNTLERVLDYFINGDLGRNLTNGGQNQHNAFDKNLETPKTLLVTSSLRTTVVELFWFKMDAANKAILERTKKTRSVSRSLVTKQINKLESEISNTADKTTVHEIYMQLISKFEELSTLDKEIENLIDVESLEEEIVTREEYRYIYIYKFIIWKIRAERYVESVSNTAIQNSEENQPHKT